MRTPRQIKIDRAVLEVLGVVPSGFLLPEEILYADAARLVLPKPTVSEIAEAVAHADGQRRIIGITGEAAVKWKLADAGRAWLAENP